MRGRFSIQGTTLFSTANASISLISLGGPIALPVTFTAFAIRVKAFMGGSSPLSGALNRQLDRGPPRNNTTNWEQYLPNLDQGAAGFEEGQVVGHRHVAARDSRNDQVQTPRMLLSPIQVISSGDVVIGAQLQDLGPLLVFPRNTDYLVSTKSLCKQNAEVTEAANTNNAD